MQQKSGNSKGFRFAIAREVEHFTGERGDYRIEEQQCARELAEMQADAIVRIVFSAGADALDADAKERRRLTEQTIVQVRLVARGAEATRAAAKTTKSGE